MPKSFSDTNVTKWQNYISTGMTEDLDFLSLRFMNLTVYIYLCMHRNLSVSLFYY